MIIPLISACLLLSGSAASRTDDCERGSSPLIDSRPGLHSGDRDVYSFRYESRVEAYSEAARKYIWCIENRSMHYAAWFVWGDGKYFHNIIEPMKRSPQIRTDSSEMIVDARPLKFKALARTDWEAIIPETISHRRLGKSLRYRFAQFTPSQSKTDGPGNNLGAGTWGYVDLMALSREPNQLAAYLSSQKTPVRLFSATIATLPANLETHGAIESGKYGKYDAADFVRVRIGITNSLSITPKGPEWTVALEAMPADPEDAARFASAAKELPFSISVDAVDPANQPMASSFKWQAALDGKGFSKLIAAGPAKSLSQVDLVIKLRIRGSDTVYASIPARLLVSRG